MSNRFKVQNMTLRLAVALVFVSCMLATAAQTITSVSLSDPVRLVLGLDGGVTYAERIHALNRLDHDLQSHDAEGLLRLLIDPELIADLTPGQQSVLLNDTMKKLRLQSAPPSGLERAMIALYEDTRRDVQIRDYALQQLSEWYPRARYPEMLKESFYDALHEREGTIAGTAILALARAAQERGADVNRRDVEATALRIAADTGYSPSIRVSAIQVCALLGVEEVLPLVRQEVRKSDDSHLKISAIAALGYLGDRSDVTLLDELTSDPGRRPYVAANAAKKRIKQRFELQP